MPPPDPGSGSNSSSNIRVFVHWDEQTIFAGEELTCTITFKNVAPTSTAILGRTSSTRGAGTAGSSTTSSSRHASTNMLPAGGSRLGIPGTGAATAGRGGAAGAGAGHRSSHSLSVPSSSRTSRSRSGSAQQQLWPGLEENGSERGSSGNSTGPGSGNGHARSGSVMSLANGSAGRFQRAGRGHARAASLQISSGSANGAYSVSSPQQTPNGSASSPSYPPNSSRSGAFPGQKTSRVLPNSSPHTPSTPLSGFKFPTIDTMLAESVDSPISQVEERNGSPANGSSDDGITVDKRHGNGASQTSVAARVLSTTSAAGTPRSSGEFYSMSNHSDETLASEYVVAAQPTRTSRRPPHTRQRSNLAPQKPKAPETLMMGYAQVHGSFTLDGSLVSLAPFDQVKRKAAVGGQGGGVIGVDTAKRESGMLKGFGWSNITSSLGELLGGGELSSIKDMRGIASAKAIPLLSTPQSILFVDLQLAPGDSKTFQYSFRIPKGLPPTHRGRAMKIAYSLVIGTQRPGGVKEQQIRSAEVPFRVLGSVNSHGEILGHDLMSPYVLLRDQATVTTIEKRIKNSQDGDLLPETKHAQQQSSSSSAPSASTLNSFLSYVNELANRPRSSSRSGLLSPSDVTSSTASRRQSMFDSTPTTAREAIDLAILRSNHASSTTSTAPNRFEIARNGRRVGVILLARPAYRLGETVTLAIDFANSAMPCFAVRLALETMEKVDPGLAMRSEASIARASRKVYVAASEAVLYGRRVVFTPTIPVGATPEFVTSGVGLEWRVRVEFVVARETMPQQEEGQRSSISPQEGEEGEEEDEREDEMTETRQSGNSERRESVDGNGNGVEDGNYDEKKTADGEDIPAALTLPVVSPTKQAQPHPHPQPQQTQKIQSPPTSSLPDPQTPHPLLEQLTRDTRGGLVLIATENMPCESFEVSVPIRVYGAVCKGLERLDRDDAAEHGVAV